LHKIVWNLAHARPRPSRNRSVPEAARPVAPGSYLVVLTVDGREYRQALRVEEEK